VANSTVDIEDMCIVCEPLPSEALVTTYPMKAGRKRAREELDIVNVVEWYRNATSERLFLLVRRPEDGRCRFLVS
jgi:A/G-specific adenine glycosylase